MFKKILGAFVAAVLVLLVVVAMQPSTYHVERSLTVPAEPDVAYAVLSDFKRFNDWSPWAELDPEMKTTFSGAPTGPGAIYEWSGNEQVGRGKMEITKADPGKRIDIHLTFFEPFASESETYYLVEPAPGGAKVSWVMDGDNGFMEKAVGLFMDMEGMIAKDFDKGLAKFASVSKAEAKKIADEKARVVAEAEAAKAAAEAAEGEAAPAEAAAP